MAWSAVVMAHGTGWGPDVLPVPPIAVALCAAYVVVLVGVRAGTRPAPATAGPEQRSWKIEIKPGPPMWLTRGVGVGVLVVALVMSSVDGIASGTGRLWPLVVSDAVWPLLVVLAVAFGDVWWRFDPWGSLAHLVAPSVQLHLPRRDVRWAVPMAFGVVWFLYAWPAARYPSGLATGLVAYTIVTVAGAAIAGRHWLSQAEPVGVWLSWFARIRRRGLEGWVPEHGAGPIIGIVATGALYRELRPSSWGSTVLLFTGRVPPVLQFAIVCVPIVMIVMAAERWARRRGAAGAVLAACVPTTAGLVVAMSLTNSALLYAAHGGLQLLGIRRGLPPPVLGIRVQILTQILILVASTAAGAAAATRRTGDHRAAAPAILVCAVFVTGATLLITAA